MEFNINHHFSALLHHVHKYKNISMECLKPQIGQKKNDSRKWKLKPTYEPSVH